MKTLKIYSIIVLCVFISIEGLSLPEDNENFINNDELDIFDTPEDIRKKQSENMQEYRHTVIQPCDDFLNYACGKSLNYYSHNSAQVQRQSDMILATFDYIKSLVNDTKENHRAIDVIKKLKVFYSSCENYYNSDFTDINEIMEVLKSYGGSAPLWKSDWENDEFDWIKLSAYSTIFNIPIFFDTDFIKDFKNPNKIIIQFQPVEYKFHVTQNWNKYEEFVENVFKLTGIDDETAKSSTSEIVKFEKILSELNDFGDYPWKLSMKEMIDNFPEINWKNYFSIILDTNEDDLDQSIEIHLIYSNKFKQILDLIKSYDLEKLANFMVWRFLRGKYYMFDSHYKNEFEKIEFHYDRRFDRTTADSNKPNCLSDIMYYLYPIPGSLFLNKRFVEPEKEPITKLFNELKNTLFNMLLESNSMDNHIKTETINYLKELNMKIGHLTKLTIVELNDLYSGLEIKRNKHFSNILSAHLFEYKRNFKNDQIKFNLQLWSHRITDLFDYKKIGSDTIQIPCSELQPTNFNHNFPNAVNIGGMGATLAYHIIKDFPFIKDSTTFWHMELLNTESCFKFYFNQTEITPTEFLIQSLALQTSFQTLMNVLPSNYDSKIEELPEFDMHALRLFFLNYAQNRCEFRKDDENYKLGTKLILAHSKGFVNAFSCSFGSKMNPRNKCRLLRL